MQEAARPRYGCPMVCSLRAALFLVATLGAAACGGNVVVDGIGGVGGLGGAGGSNTTAPAVTTGFGVTSSASVSSSVAVSSSASVSSSTGTGGTTCVPADGCSQCPDNASCTACDKQLYQAGIPLYDALLTCVLCGDCYFTCMAPSSDCPSPPASKSPCDTGINTDAACNACQMCSIQGQCAPEAQQCQNDANCLALVNALPSCPM